MYLKMENSINFTLPLFTEIGIIQLEWERKLEKVKKHSGKRIAVRKKNSPFNAIPILGDIL